MEQDNVVSFGRPDEPSEDSLTEVLRHGARALLAQAIEAAAAAFLANHADLVDEAGRRRQVRNRFLPGR
jgi:putative transposase